MAGWRAGWVTGQLIDWVSEINVVNWMCFSAPLTAHWFRKSSAGLSRWWGICVLLSWWTHSHPSFWESKREVALLTRVSQRWTTVNLVIYEQGAQGKITDLTTRGNTLAHWSKTVVNWPTDNYTWANRKKSICIYFVIGYNERVNTTQISEQTLKISNWQNIMMIIISCTFPSNLFLYVQPLLSTFLLVALGSDILSC